MKAPLFKLNWRDFGHGLVTSVLGAMTVGVYQMINEGKLPTSAADLKTIGISAAGAGVGYILKNIFSNSAGNFAQAESKAPAIIQVPKPEANADTTVQQTITTNIKP